MIRQVGIVSPLGKLLPTRSRAANGQSAVTKPILVDRRVPQPNFSYAKHQVDPATQKPLECNICHQATQSRENAGCAHADESELDHLSHLSRADCRAQSRSSVKEMLLRKR
ncbi:MAG: hypothetical protein DME63_06375 [Verrucomicrobia bacterium]|nr:MAG: hypothetical protein DME63_06375 [Verrucomicrobiota bacterium]